MDTLALEAPASAGPAELKPMLVNNTGLLFFLGNVLCVDEAKVQAQLEFDLSFCPLNPGDVFFFSRRCNFSFFSSLFSRSEARKVLRATVFWFPHHSVPV